MVLLKAVITLAVAAIATVTIHAEAWSVSEEVLSTSDSGDDIWFAFNESELAQFKRGLDVAGLRLEDVSA